MNAPNEYRLSDEGAGNARRGPWHPLGLFAITFIFAPVGTLLFWLNWGRLGFSEKQKKWLLPTIFVAALPFVVAILAPQIGIALERGTVRTIGTLAKFAIAYSYHLAQSPIYAGQRERGEKTAPALWLWVTAVVLIGGQIAAVALTRK